MGAAPPTHAVLSALEGQLPLQASRSQAPVEAVGGEGAAPVLTLQRPPGQPARKAGLPRHAAVELEWDRLGAQGGS